MKKIKVNAELYVSDDKLATIPEVNNIVNNSVVRVIDTTGDGSKFLSDDGTYKNAGTDTEQVKTEIGETLSDYGIQQSGNDGFYIVDKDGNIIFKIDNSGVNFVGMSDLKSPKGPYSGMKMISIGDSLSAHDKWQKYVAEWSGMTFDNDENLHGKDGHACMAKGGTSVFPDSADSIYMRALDAHYYNPDVIFLYAGQNDINHFAGESNVNQSALGTIDDKPYLLDKIYTEATVDEKATYTSWYEGRPTAYSSFQGLLQRLMTDNPTAKIFILTGMKNYQSTGVQSNGRPIVAKMWKEIGAKYGVKVFDAWNEIGVNEFNASAYYPSAGNVHNTDFGYKRYAEFVYSCM